MTTRLVLEWSKRHSCKGGAAILPLWGKNHPECGLNQKTQSQEMERERSAPGHVVWTLVKLAAPTNLNHKYHLHFFFPLKLVWVEFSVTYNQNDEALNKGSKTGMTARGQTEKTQLGRKNRELTFRKTYYVHFHVEITIHPPNKSCWQAPRGSRLLA